MKPDVLFWFYKDFEICHERLERLRRLNEGVRIYALFGGPISDAEKAKNAIHKLIDDFYVYPHKKDAKWKWQHGDQMIATWYLERGQNLKWETLFIMQWDMLILEPLQKLFHGLKPGEILLSGFRPLNTVASWWLWANPKKSDILSFKKMLLYEFNYEEGLFACLFIVVCLPRIFLEKYVAINHPEVGFLEYKIPTMARIFGVPVCNNHSFEPWWAANPTTKNAHADQRILNAVGQEIHLSTILRELSKSNGKRLFHPVYKAFPDWLIKQNKATITILYILFSFFEFSTKSAKKIVRHVANLTSILPSLVNKNLLL